MVRKLPVPSGVRKDSLPPSGAGAREGALPASAAGPLSSLSSPRGWGLCQMEMLGDGPRGARRRGTGGGSARERTFGRDRQRRQGERDGTAVWGPSTGRAQPATPRRPPPPLTAPLSPGTPCREPCNLESPLPDPSHFPRHHRAFPQRLPPLPPRPPSPARPPRLPGALMLCQPRGASSVQAAGFLPGALPSVPPARRGAAGPGAGSGPPRQEADRRPVRPKREKRGESVSPTGRVGEGNAKPDRK